jgi:hypothetical protein
VTPIVVVLREYAARRDAAPDLSILDFVRSAARASQQWPAVPAGAFEYLLASGRAAVFFDGLDELLDTGARRDVTAAVEAFGRRYPNVPMLVTSREVGYAEAALDPAEFSVFVLDGFTPADARAYVRRRFRIDEAGTPGECAALADGFMRESQAASDLRANPLMLGLLCTIYRGEGYIPQNRPAVYEKCAIMLFERWDRRRRIATRFSYDEDLGPIVQHLAYRIYADQKLHAGVPEDALIQAAATYLWPRRFEDRDRAVAFAREFVEHCRGRAWVFTDVGSTGAGDPLYQFTHRTFLEYFAAAYLVRQHPTPDRLSAALLPRIARVEWDVVAQLAVQIQSRQVEDAASAHLALLLQHAAAAAGEAAAREAAAGGEAVDGTEGGSDGGGGGRPNAAANAAANIVAFAARLLGFLTPAPALVRRVVAAAFRHALDPRPPGPPRAGARGGGRRRGGVGRPTAGALIQAVLGVAPQNLATAVAEVETVCIAACDDPAVGPLALAYGATLGNAAYMSGLLEGGGDRAAAWDAAAERIYAAARPHLRTAAEASLFVAQIAARRGDGSYEDIVRWHGAEAVFVAADLHPFDFYVLPPAERLLASLAGDPNAPPAPAVAAEVGQLGRALRAAPTPWVPADTGSRPTVDLLPLRRPGAPASDSDARPREPAPLPDAAWDGDVAFGLFALAAVVIELREQLAEPRGPAQDSGRDAGYVALDELPAFARLRTTMAARHFPLFASAAVPEMENARLSPEDRAFIGRWHAGEVRLVEEPNDAPVQAALDFRPAPGPA